MKTRGLCVLQTELNMSLKTQHQTHFKVKHSGTAIRSCIYYRLTLCKYLMRKDIAKQEQKISLQEAGFVVKVPANM